VQMCSFLRCCVRCRVNNNQIRCTVSLVATMRWQMRLLDLVWAEHAGFMDILLSRRHIWIITAGLNLLFNRLPSPTAGYIRGWVQVYTTARGRGGGWVQVYTTARRRGGGCSFQPCRR
jgi:hypothetical protein